MGRANERKGCHVVCGPSLSRAEEYNDGDRLLGTTPPHPLLQRHGDSSDDGRDCRGRGGKAKVMAMNQREMMCTVSPHHPLMMVTMADHPGE